MPNPLEGFGTSPAPPNPEAGSGNMLQQGGGAAPASKAPAPPTHAETVAALRHFDAIKGELTTLLRNPALGKSDVKSSVIDGVTKLVSERIISPSQAVIQLSQVPTDPLQQRKWIQTQMAQTQQAENAVLDHYGHGNPSLGDVAGHVATMDHGNRDDHLDHMQALAANYGGGK